MLLAGCDTNRARIADADRMQALKQEYLDTGQITALLELERIAMESDSFRRGYAISTIGSIGPKAVHAVPVLIQALNSKDHSVERAAALALGPVSVGSDLAVEALVEKLKYEEVDSDIAWFCAESLGIIGAPAKGSLTLLRQLSSSTNQSMTDSSKSAVEKIEESLKLKE